LPASGEKGPSKSEFDAGRGSLGKGFAGFHKKILFFCPARSEVRLHRENTYALPAHTFRGQSDKKPETPWRSRLLRENVRNRRLGLSANYGTPERVLAGVFIVIQ